MKLITYARIYKAQDGTGLRVGGFQSLQEAWDFEEFKCLRGEVFVGIERHFQEITQEQLLAQACIVCGFPVGPYQTAWRNYETGRRAHTTHPRPPGFVSFSDG